MKFGYNAHVQVISDGFFKGMTGYAIDVNTSDPKQIKYLIRNESGAQKWFLESSLQAIK